MTKLNGCIIAVAALAASGCNYIGATSEERACRSYLTNTSLNPETLEFYDFRPFTREELRKLSGIDNSLAMAMDEEAHKDASIAISQTAESIDRIAETVGAEQYIFRVKSENAVGDLITTQYMCSVKEDICFCGDPDA